MTIFSELSQDIERGAAGRIVRWVDGILGEILVGDLVVDAVSHPLGFLCLPVYRRGDEGVCVHLWERRWRHDSLTTSPTHCHSWELLSWVLVGELRNQILRITDDVVAPTHRVFEVRSEADGDEIRATPRLVHVDVAAETAHAAGESYRLPAGVFHETVIPDSGGPVVTIALGRVVAGTVDLSLGGTHTTGHRVRRTVCDRDVTVRAVEAIRAALAGAARVRP
jgi:hypothetical protein